MYNKKWKIRSQEIRDLFFRMKLLLNIKITILSIYLDIDKSTLYRWLKQGQIKPINPTRTKGFNKKIISDINNELIEYIQTNNTLTLEEICKYIQEKYIIQISISTIHKFLISNKITYKKSTIYYSESDKLKTSKFIEDIKKQNLEKVTILDEASFVLNHSKSFARSIKGKRAIIVKPGNRLKRYSLLLSMNSCKMYNWELYEKSIDSVKFHSFMTKIPNGNNVVMDNARIHHSTNVLSKIGLDTIKELSNKKDLKLNYLPPYSPFLNPIELCFNIIRTYINKNKPRTFEELKNRITIAINNITESICKSIINKVWS